jgi:hypothetical protein
MTKQEDKPYIKCQYCGMRFLINGGMWFTHPFDDHMLEFQQRFPKVTRKVTDCVKTFFLQTD